MKIILHGILAERFGREFEIQTNVPADAIEGLSRQIPDWPRELLIDVPGFGTEALLRFPTTKSEIHLVPAMHGGGGKWGQIIMGAALIAVGAVLTWVVPGGAAYGIPLMMTGGGMLLGGVAQFFMKAPSVDKSQDPPASKFLGNSKNTTNIGTLITMAWGRVKLGGHWLSVQVDSNDLVTTSFPATTS
jgi:predicted phage tail protein